MEEASLACLKTGQGWSCRAIVCRPEKVKDNSSRQGLSPAVPLAVQRRGHRMPSLFPLISHPPLHLPALQFSHIPIHPLFLCPSPSPFVSPSIRLFMPSSIHPVIFQPIHLSIHPSSQPPRPSSLPPNHPPIPSTHPQLTPHLQNLSSTRQALSPASLIHCSPADPDSQVGSCCLEFAPLSWMSSRLVTTPVSWSASRPSRSCTPSSKLCLSLSRWVEGMSP